MTKPPTALGRAIRKDRAGRLDPFTKAKPEGRRHQALRWGFIGEGAIRFIEEGTRRVRPAKAQQFAHKLKVTKAKALELIAWHNDTVPSILQGTGP